MTSEIAFRIDYALATLLDEIEGSGRTSRPVNVELSRELISRARNLLQVVVLADALEETHAKVIEAAS